MIENIGILLVTLNDDYLSYSIRLSFLDSNSDAVDHNLCYDSML